MEETLEIILVDAINGRPNKEWPPRIVEIYYKRLSADPRITAAKERIEALKTDVVVVDDLRVQIQTMKPRSGIYKLLKDELGKLGHWKNRPRGKADPSHFNGK
jgi:hypothetical protein